MKEIKTNKIEQALSMYRETVSPAEENLLAILNQIPEKEFVEQKKATIRSPYIWIVIPEIITLCFMFAVSFPTLQEMYTNRNDPFYSIDKDVDHFDSLINDEDYKDVMVDYNNI